MATRSSDVPDADQSDVPDADRSDVPDAAQSDVPDAAQSDVPDADRSVSRSALWSVVRSVPRSMLVLLLTAQIAMAADPPASDTPPWLSDAAKSASDAARAAGATVGGWWQDLTASVAPGGPAGQLPAQISDEDKTFFAILEAIGLKLTDVKVGSGLLQNASYRFVASREPSDSDVQRAEQMLRAYRDKESGIRSRAKQRIGRSILDTVATAGFALASVEVTLQPWPDASYHVVARPTGTATTPRQ